MPPWRRGIGRIGSAGAPCRCPMPGRPSLARRPTNRMARPPLTATRTPDHGRSIVGFLHGSLLSIVAKAVSDSAPVVGEEYAEDVRLSRLGRGAFHACPGSSDAAKPPISRCRRCLRASARGGFPHPQRRGLGFPSMSKCLRESAGCSAAMLRRSAATRSSELMPSRCRFRKMAGRSIG
jgi:hypothetical protein